MKTKTFFILCLLLGIVTMQLSAQNGKNGSGTIKSDITVDNWSGPVFCDGVLSDLITCSSLSVEVTVHYVNGVEQWGINKVKTREFTSVNTGEVYKGEAMFDHWSDVKGIDKFHYNLIGDKGGNISLHITIDLSTFEFVDIQSNCH